MNNDQHTTRRGALGIGLGAAAALAVTYPAQAQEKLAQNVVQYQTSPKDGNECDKCVNWVAPASCKIVAGTINPKGWCVAYAPKEG